jgi:hypothetical protein
MVIVSAATQSTRSGFRAILQARDDSPNLKRLTSSLKGVCTSPMSSMVDIGPAEGGREAKENE